MKALKLSLIVDFVDRATRPLRRLNERLSAIGKNDGFRRLAEVAERSSGRVNAAMGRITAGLGRALGAGALGVAGLGFSVLKTGMEFERFLTILTTLEGSATKARASMAWVQKFAQTTPYSLDQVMESFVRLKAYGIDPTDGTLRVLGDTASAMGKQVMDAVEMLADAQTGEFERLKEFGVRASQAGNQVTLKWTQDGKDRALTTQKSAAAIRKALFSIFDAKFKGAMDAQSKTFAGMISNLMDQWTNFQKMIADAGVFDMVKAQLARLMERLDKLAKSGALKKWAEQLSAKLVDLFKALEPMVTQIDWVKLAGSIAGLAVSIAGFVNAVGGLHNLIDAVFIAMIINWGVGMLALAPAIATVASALVGLQIAAGPIGWIILAITGIAALAYLLISRWSQVKAFFKGLWDNITTIFQAAWKKIEAVTPPWLMNLLKFAAKGLSFVFPVGAMVQAGQRLAQGGAAPAPAGATLPATRGGAQTVRNEISVKISEDRPARVTAMKSSSPSTDLQVKRGIQPDYLF